MIEQRLNVNKTNNKNIRNNERGEEKIVLKCNSKGIPQYNDTVNVHVAVDQFKELTEEQTERKMSEKCLWLILSPIN